MSYEHEDLIISLMEARKKGKTIQWFNEFERAWEHMLSSDLNFPRNLKYRIKPDEPREFLLAKWKGEDDICDNYWIICSGEKCHAENYDYIRVREILED